MAWYCQATSHYLSQCWPRSLSPNGITRPQWVNFIDSLTSVGFNVSSIEASSVPLYLCSIYNFEFCILCAVQLLPNCYERAAQLFVQYLVQLTTKETPKPGITFFGDWWISLKWTSKVESFSMLLCSRWTSTKFTFSISWMYLKCKCIPMLNFSFNSNMEKIHSV